MRAHLPEYARPAATFAYLTGWRLKSEILTLQWRQMDFKAGVVTLDVGTTKNRDGRTFPMVPELRAMLEAQRAATDTLQRKTGSIIPYVFHGTKRGRPLFRDLQRRGARPVSRPACRDASRTTFAGQPCETSNAPACRGPRPWRWSGHRTEAIYRRYAIVDEVMLHEGAALSGYSK